MGVPKYIQLHEEAGLITDGIFNSDGDLEWLGTDKQWRKYEELCREEALKDFNK